jgi:uncharacterized protein (DUF1015 family)
MTTRIGNTGRHCLFGYNHQRHTTPENSQCLLLAHRSTTSSMARIYPFRALRYNPSLVRVEDCVTQPYDKISPSMQQAYYQRSPYNLVRIILGLPELFDGEGTGDVYTRAARDFAEWRKTNILTAENEPCIYAYSQRFTIPGTQTVVERRGLIALGELYEYAQGVVFRHEQTLTKPRADRLNLLRATRAHFGQIFMLYSDPAQSVEQLIFDPNATPEIEVTDEYDVLHRVWQISDPGVINMVAGALSDKKLIIADGHHRYETALAYSKEKAPAAPPAYSERNSQRLPQPAYPEAAVMMTLVNMDGAGLVILPTHRVVHSLAGFSAEEFLAKAAEYFEVSPIAARDPESLMQAVKKAGQVGGTSGSAMVAVTREGASLLVAKPSAVAEALSAVSPRKRHLDVVQLHQLVLEQLLAISPEAIRDQANLRYVRDAGEAVAQVVRRGDADIAFLVNPVTLDQLREVTFAGEVMPQKSTDFFPKLLSGLAVYALD